LSRRFITGFLAGVVTALAVAALVAALVGEFEEGDLTSQVSDVVQDDYYKPVAGSTLDHASVDGIIRELRHRYHDRFSHYLDPLAEAVRGGLLGALLRCGPDRHRRQARAAGGGRIAGHAGGARGDRGG